MILDESTLASLSTIREHVSVLAVIGTGKSGNSSLCNTFIGSYPCFAGKEGNGKGVEPGELY